MKWFISLLLLSLFSSCWGDMSNWGNSCSSQCRDGLVCLNQTCQYCVTDAQCEKENSQTRCILSQFMMSTEYLCLHKTLFGCSITEADLLSFTIFFVASAISAGGGVGGGGIFVPILILIAKFSPMEAVPLSNIIVAGASVANFIQNFYKRHPNHPSRPLIDYPVALLIEPQTLGGTVVGVYLHQIFPSWVILLLLIIVMSITTIRTTLRGVSLYKQENLKKEGGGVADPLINAVRKSVEKKGMIIPWSKIILLLTILIISTVISVIKGGGGAVSVVGIQACSLWYWVSAAAIFPVIFLVWGYEGYIVVQQAADLNSKDVILTFGEIRWNKMRIIVVGLVSFLAGILASLLGVGGGLIKGPVLIEIGLPPDVVAATSSYMILFTSVSSSIQYILIGKIMWDYGVVLFVIGMVASFVGQTILNWIVGKYARKSFIIFVIALVIGASAVLLVLSEVVQFLQTGGDNSFQWSCPD